MEEKKQPRIKILVACHKADPNIRQDDIYMPIQVGKALHPELNLGFQCDNTGDNISEKNGFYCELTALYWAWKNLKGFNYIGLCHYRRYFKISPNKLSRHIQKGRIIIPKLYHSSINTFSNFSLWTSLEDVYLLIDVILDLYPEYRNTVTNYFFNDNRISVCNMFIMDRIKFDEYCIFLFSIMFHLEHKLKHYPYSRQQRVLGYLSETLLLLWIRQNKYTPITSPIDDLSMKKPKIPYWIDCLRKDISFYMGRPLRKCKKIIVWDAVKAGFNKDLINLRNI